ncbi:MAG: DoxX family protein [Rhizobiales bacterium]|nr:DoxX family protein [Hyphomicrobiales bacterium]
MSDVSNSRLIIPGFGRVYRAAAPWTELLIRLMAGLSLLPHGWPKLMNLTASGAFLEKSGYSPGLLWATLIACTEVFGGILLALGLFTRVACVPILIFLLVAVIHHSQFGYVWNNRGLEYPLFWAIVVFHFLMNGGGRYSLDAKLGREF